VCELWFVSGEWISKDYAVSCLGLCSELLRFDSFSAGKITDMGEIRAELDDDRDEGCEPLMDRFSRAFLLNILRYLLNQCSEFFCLCCCSHQIALLQVAVRLVFGESEGFQASIS